MKDTIFPLESRMQLQSAAKTSFLVAFLFLFFLLSIATGFLGAGGG